MLNVFRLLRNAGIVIAPCVKLYEIPPQFLADKPSAFSTSVSVSSASAPPIF